MGSDANHQLLESDVESEQHDVVTYANGNRLPVRHSMQNKAVVVGALGVIGRYIVERLVEEPNWDVVGLSRRNATDRPHYRHIAVDLLDPEEAKSRLAELT